MAEDITTIKLPKTLKEELAKIQKRDSHNPIFTPRFWKSCRFSLLLSSQAVSGILQFLPS